MTTNLIEISKDVEIEFKDKESKRRWGCWKRIHDNTRNSKMVDFATDMMKCMQYLKANKKLEAEMVRKAYDACFQIHYDIFPIWAMGTSFIIAENWKYGSEFNSFTFETSN